MDKEDIDAANKIMFPFVYCASITKESGRLEAKLGDVSWYAGDNSRPGQSYVVKGTAVGARDLANRILRLVENLYTPIHNTRLSLCQSLRMAPPRLSVTTLDT